MPDPTTTARARLDALAAQLEPSVRDGFLRSVRLLRRSVALTRLADAITYGDVDGALRIIFGSPDAAAALGEVGQAVREAVTRAGAVWRVEVARIIREGPTQALLRVEGAAFNSGAVSARSLTAAPSTLRALSAARLAAQREAETNIRAGARVAIIDAVRATTERGVNPKEAARQVRDVLGLGESDTRLVQRVRADLASGDPERLRAQLAREGRDKRFDATLEKAASGGKALTPEQVDAQAAAYERKLRRRRAEASARTVALDAAKQGQRDEWDRAVSEGSVRGDCVTGEWRTAGDERVRPQHRRMNHARRLRGESYRDPASARTWEYPGQSDYVCRCVETVIVHATPYLAREYVRQGSGRSADQVPNEPDRSQAATATLRPAAGQRRFRPLAGAR